MKIDTGWTHPDIAATTAAVEPGQYIVVRDWKRAQSLFNKIRSNIEAHEDQRDLDVYMQREELTLDALHLFDPHVSAELQDIYQTHRACLVHGGAAREAHSSQSQTAHIGKKGKEDETGYW